MHQQWDLNRAAVWGAVLGAPLLGAHYLITGEAIPSDTVQLAANVIGGVLGGALLFMAVAGLRNRIR